MLRVLPIVMALLVAAGCEKTTHENIDKWTHTEKGPTKLKKTLSDESLDPDLSAHAAANMLKKGSDPDLRAGFEQMSQPRRIQVIEKLAPRLWDIARVEKEENLPGAMQVAAKDELVVLRKYASDPEKTQIDTYLTDWYAVTSYEARAQVGAILGAAVMRLVGAPAGKKLMSVANQVIAAPGQDKTKNRIGDELLLGLAATGNADSVKYVLDVAKMDRGDTTLSTRALSALYKAYIDPGGLFDVADPEALTPNLDTLQAIAADDSQPGQVANDAVALIRATPKCLPTLVAMVAHPHNNPRFKYVAANNALKCGGTKAIAEVVRALPDTGAYWKDELTGAISGEIAKMTPRDQVLTALRELVGDKATVTKWIAIEALAAMKSTEDAPRIAALASNKERLAGYWGEESDAHKEDPTLGQRARELADQLGKAH